MTLDNLSSIIKSFPRTPGVYTFQNNKEKPLYIGKAANLRSRLLSYLKLGDPRIQKMIDLAETITYEETGSDIEALILESQRIKKQKPQFNIMLRDDKQYFFVVFTPEKFPKIFLTHQPQKFKNTPIGPFTDGAALKVTLKILRRFFPYCTCKQFHHVRCLNAHIGKCLGFCCLKNSKHVDKKLYKKNIRAIKDILNGKKSTVIRNMEKEMSLEANQGKLERAIELRDKIKQIKRVFENAQIISRHRQNSDGNLLELKKALRLDNFPHRIEGYDVSNIQGIHATGSMVAFIDGLPDKNEYRKFKIRQTFSSKNLGGQVRGGNDTGMLREIIGRRLTHGEWTYPDLIIVDGGKGQLNAAYGIISNFQFPIFNSKPIVIALTKNDKHVGDHLTIKVGEKFKLIPLAKLPESTKNLILAIDTEAHRFAILYYRKLHGRSLRLRS